MVLTVPKNVLRFLLLADCHGDATQVEAIVRSLSKRSFEPDATILAGDIGGTVHPSLLFSYLILRRNLKRSQYAHWVFKGKGRRFFEVHQIRSTLSVIKALQDLKSRIYAVLGNSDLEIVASVLSGQRRADCIFVDRQNIEINGLRVVGISGALTYLGKSPIGDNEFSVSSFSQHVTALTKRISLEKKRQMLLITHEAPKLRLNSLKRGSQAITNFISIFRPLVAIFGHHHQAPGIFRIGQTVAINPGPAVAGHFGILTLDLGSNLTRINVQLFKLPGKKRSFARTIYNIRDWALRRHSN
ncbi:MAG: metallophosphoesterase family protein [Candidatus Hodarchaeota archaeon]